MVGALHHDREESQPLTGDTADSQHSDHSSSSRTLRRSTSSSSISTLSVILEHADAQSNGKAKFDRYRDTDGDDGTPDKDKELFEELDIEEAAGQTVRPVDKKYKRWLIILGSVCAAGWVLALFLFVFNGNYRHRSQLEHDPDAVMTSGNGRKITLDSIQAGMWRARSHAISWIDIPDGRDGMMLEKGVDDNAYLVVEDVLSLEAHPSATNRTVLMRKPGFQTVAGFKMPVEQWPSPDLRTVLCLVEKQKNWRHSYIGGYWLFDVATQKPRPLVEDEPEAQIQLVHWAPDSSAVVFVRDNNLFLRNLDSPEIRQITESGGDEMFNGVPDWVYEEEVFSGNSATWWSPDAKYIAFLATNETMVPEFPVQYFIQRPSGTVPEPGLEEYPDTRYIKYPKAGAPNPTVHIRFYDVEQHQVFDVAIEDDFPDDDRLITEVVWAGETGKVLVRQTNRESDILKMVLVDVTTREGRIVRTQDVNALDGGWFEITETTTFVPRDDENGRPTDGYIDTVIYKGYDHLGYFKSLDDEEPLMLTTGKWEVVDAPSALDLKNNFVYFVGTKDGSIQRHVYRVALDGSKLEAITDVSVDGYYDVSFSKKAGYALLSYQGPKVPWQSVITTPSNSETFNHSLETNDALSKMASETELPLKIYSTLKVNGTDINVVERRPHSFDESKKYPVLFFLYGGPGSQQVSKQFVVDFQSYVAATLGYVVVTVDNRGTGFIGREARTLIRGNLGHYEAMDQITAAKEWGKKSYIDASRIAIWGWSYGGYMTLKTLEQDAGETFHYGMAVAPVTDWLYYDTIYTERWMRTPQHNPDGYANSSISDVRAIGKNVRFLIMHGTSDDNVHTQNTLTLLDKFDLAGVENYDLHFFPDSDHSIFFHNANRIVYDKLSWWLTNAFNGEWARIQKVKPLRAGAQVGTTPE